jgi:hypothetical protein
MHQAARFTLLARLEQRALAVEAGESDDGGRGVSHAGKTTQIFISWLPDIHS